MLEMPRTWPAMRLSRFSSAALCGCTTCPGWQVSSPLPGRFAVCLSGDLISGILDGRFELRRVGYAGIVLQRRLRLVERDIDCFDPVDALQYPLHAVYAAHAGHSGHFQRYGFHVFLLYWVVSDKRSE